MPRLLPRARLIASDFCELSSLLVLVTINKNTWSPGVERKKKRGRGSSLRADEEDEELEREREREREREGREKKVERKSGLIRRGITEVIEAELCKAMRQERKNWAQSRLAPRNGHAYGELWRGNNCFFAFRKPLSLSLSTHVSTLGIFLRSSYLLAGRCAAKRRNLISIKFYDCNESVAQRWRFRHATAKLSTSGPCYIARVTRFSRGNRGRIKFLWGRNGFDRKPGIGLSDRFFYSSAEGMARR